LVLELDVDIFTKVLELLVIVPIPEATCPVVNIDDEDLLMERQPRKILDWE
jgi:predicted GNAT family N-acyltransferase